MQLRAHARIENTLGLVARARFLARVSHSAELAGLFQRYEHLPAPPLVLGAGSNVVFRDDFPGLVVQFRGASIQLLRCTSEHVALRVGAGKNWHALVSWCLQMGYYGLENLALIPGTVGAAPVQNIGAYGVELRTLVQAVGVFDRKHRRAETLPGTACGFGYRDSCFKRQPGRYLITHVDLQLHRHSKPNLDYPALRHFIAAPQPDARDVFAAVVALRRQRLPDPGQCPNVGSFFKNPVLDSSTAASLRERFPDLPVYALSNGQCKLSAAHLIEGCGLKGYRLGPASVSGRHALVLVAQRGATGADIIHLARHVRTMVMDRYGVELQVEPRLIGARWSEMW